VRREGGRGVERMRMLVGRSVEGREGAWGGKERVGGVMLG